MSARLFVGDDRVADRDADAVLAEGRGFAYGDLVFETMRSCDAAVHWWPGHRARLALGSARLRIPLPSPERLEDELHGWLAEHPESVIKLVVSRGSGGRGYTPALEAPPVWALIASSLPPPPRPGGLNLRWCETRMAIQPLLAGIKHGNRLEQIMARAEFNDPDIDEGLMCDTEGHAVSAIAANLFVLHAGRWWTPPVDRCGIAGVCRSWVLRAVAASERRLHPEDVEAADAVVLCNAVRGILPVASLGQRRWSPHPAVLEARNRLARANPAFPAD